MAKWDILEGIPQQFVLRDISHDIFVYWTYHICYYRTLVLGGYSDSWITIDSRINEEHNNLREEMWSDNPEALESCKEQILGLRNIRRKRYEQGLARQINVYLPDVIHPSRYDTWGLGKLPDYEFKDT